MKAIYLTNNAYDSILIVNEGNRIQTIFSPADREEIAQVVQWNGHVAPWACWEGVPPEPGETVANYGVIVLERDDLGRVLYENARLLQERKAFWALDRA